MSRASPSASPFSPQQPAPWGASGWARSPRCRGGGSEWRRLRVGSVAAAGVGGGARVGRLGRLGRSWICAARAPAPLQARALCGLLRQLARGAVSARLLRTPADPSGASAARSLYTKEYTTLAFSGFIRKKVCGPPPHPFDSRTLTSSSHTAPCTRACASGRLGRGAGGPSAVKGPVVIK